MKVLYFSKLGFYLTYPKFKSITYCTGGPAIFELGSDGIYRIGEGVVGCYTSWDHIIRTMVPIKDLSTVEKLVYKLEK